MKSILFLLGIQLCYCFDSYEWRGYRYFISSDENLTFLESQNTCVRRHSAKLASIASFEEKNVLVSRLHNSDGNYWIGLWNDVFRCRDCRNYTGHINCTVCRKNWKWLDDTPMSEDLVQNAWHDSEPTGGSPCARLQYRLQHGFAFADFPCDRVFSYICKKEQRTVIDECESSPCVHGICTDAIDGYACKCDNTGFYGQHCEMENETESNIADSVTTDDPTISSCQERTENDNPGNTDTVIITMGCIIGLLVLTNTASFYFLLNQICFRGRKDSDETAASAYDNTYTTGHTATAMSFNMVHVNDNSQNKTGNNNEINERDSSAYEKLHIYQN